MTNYKLFLLEKGIMKILYYEDKVKYKIGFIKFKMKDNIFIPRIGDVENINSYNTNIDAFVKRRPDVKDYMQFYKEFTEKCPGYRAGLRDEWDDSFVKSLRLIMKITGFGIYINK